MGAGLTALKAFSLPSPAPRFPDRCFNEAACIEVPPVEGYVMVLQPEEPKISLSGVHHFARAASEFESPEGVSLFPELRIISTITREVEPEGDGAEDPTGNSCTWVCQPPHGPFFCAVLGFNVFVLESASETWLWVESLHRFLVRHQILRCSLRASPQEDNVPTILTGDSLSSVHRLSCFWAWDPSLQHASRMLHHCLRPQCPTS